MSAVFLVTDATLDEVGDGIRDMYVDACVQIIRRFPHAIRNREALVAHILMLKGTGDALTTTEGEK